MMDKSEFILSLFKRNEREAFRLLFDTYYDPLLFFSNQLLDDPEAAADVVQECFVDFWVNRRFVALREGVDRYLASAVKHASLNYIRGIKRRLKRHEFVMGDQVCEEESEEENAKLYEMLHTAIDRLPEERRKIFVMVCLEGMKYQAVADQLGISINTVKKQMGRAFQSLRESLKSYFYQVMLFIFLKK